MSDKETITVGNVSTPEGKEPGAEVSLPVVQVLTGRGFVTGKSGSGKSNTASVVIEELLDCGYPVMIVDTDGEYYGLKEEYELLHAGADEECDIQVSPEHAEKLANLALEENVPIILDVSGYLDADDADELLKETARHLFAKEKKLKKPFLLVVEEVHEYLPQKGGGGEVGNLLIKIGKRGRKHGLGLLGISQRPADVKKDFITQANWLVWHRLTWDNDTKVVGRVVDAEYADRVAELGDGEAFVQTDWTDADVRRVQFRRKRTFDAGATPGLEDFERPELKSVSDSLMDDLADITEEQDRRESELADLRQELDKKRARINQLEQELEKARDVSNAARQLANAFTRGDFGDASDGTDGDRIEELEATIGRKEDRIEELEASVDAKNADIAELEDALAGRDDRIDELHADLEEAYDRIDRLEAETDRLREELIDARQSRLSDLTPNTATDQSADADDPEGVDAGTTTAGTPTADDADEPSAPTDDIVNADTDEFGIGSPDDAPLVDGEAPAGSDPGGDGSDDLEASAEGDSGSDVDGSDDGERTVDPLAFGDAFDKAWPDPKSDGDGDSGIDDDAELLPGSPPKDSSGFDESRGRQSGSPGPGADDAEFLADDTPSIPDDLEARSAEELARIEPLQSDVEAAIRESQLNPEHSWAVLSILSTEGPKRPDELEPRVDARVQHVWTLLAELRGFEFVERNPDGRYELDPEAMRDRITDADDVSRQFQEFKEHAQQVD